MAPCSQFEQTGISMSYGCYIIKCQSSCTCSLQEDVWIPLLIIC